MSNLQYLHLPLQLPGYQEGKDLHEHSFGEAESLIQVQVFYKVYLLIPKRNDYLLHLTLHTMHP